MSLLSVQQIKKTFKGYLKHAPDAADRYQLWQILSDGSEKQITETECVETPGTSYVIRANKAPDGTEADWQTIHSAGIEKTHEVSRESMLAREQTRLGDHYAALAIQHLQVIKYQDSHKMTQDQFYRQWLREKDTKIEELQAELSEMREQCSRMAVEVQEAKTAGGEHWGEVITKAIDVFANYNFTNEAGKRIKAILPTLSPEEQELLFKLSASGRLLPIVQAAEPTSED